MCVNVTHTHTHMRGDEPQNGACMHKESVHTRHIVRAYEGSSPGSDSKHQVIEMEYACKRGAHQAKLRG